MSRSRDAVSPSAFTILELLIVVAIMIVLTGLLIVLLKPARDKARLAACAAQLSQLGRGTASYAVDFRGYLPPAADLTQQSGMMIWSGSDPVPRYRLYGVLLDGDYIAREGALFICPNRGDERPSLYFASGRPKWGVSGGLVVGDYSQRAVRDGVSAKLPHAVGTVLISDMWSSSNQSRQNHARQINNLRGSGQVETDDVGD